MTIRDQLELTQRQIALFKANKGYAIWGALRTQYADYLCKIRTFRKTSPRKTRLWRMCWEDACRSRLLRDFHTGLRQSCSKRLSMRRPAIYRWNNLHWRLSAERSAKRSTKCWCTSRRWFCVNAAAWLCGSLSEKNYFCTLSYSKCVGYRF